jgi:hypothetical protein
VTIAVSPDGLPALVLNADYRPLSYYPLSLWSWQDAIKAVFLDRVNIVAEYDHAVSSPSFSMRVPSVVSLKSYVKPSRHPCLHPLQRLPARPLPVPVLRHHRGPDLRPCRAAPLRRRHHLGKRGRGLLALQSEEGRRDAFRGQDVAAPEAVPAECARPAQQWAAVPAQLSARKLDGLSLLGCRTGALTAAYIALVIMLRVSGKRTLSKMNAFDLVVTVALGSTLATVLLDRSSRLPTASGVGAACLSPICHHLGIGALRPASSIWSRPPRQRSCATGSILEEKHARPARDARRDRGRAETTRRGRTG